jgi:hypothetical protein
MAHNNDIVATTSAGSSPLMDCDLIPIDFSRVPLLLMPRALQVLSECSVLSPEEHANARSLVRFITAQAIQIFEGTVVMAHNNAVSVCLSWFERSGCAGVSIVCGNGSHLESSFQ